MPYQEVFGAGTGPSGSLPSGLIVMWSGLLSAIPSGWKLCDGTLGTPDLRDKFIKGTAAAENPGVSGGAATHTHTGHSVHVVTQPTSHPATATAAANVGATAKGTTASTLTLQAHTHTTPILGHSGTAVDAHSIHDTPNSEPSFFKLAFIMKT